MTARQRGESREKATKGTSVKGDELAQLAQSWDDRFIFGETKISEHYLKGFLRVHIHFRGVCAVVERREREIGRMDLDSGFGGARLEQGKAPELPGLVESRVHGHSGSGDNQDSVFVVNVKIVENPQRIVLTPSVVRLRLLDKCCRIAGDSLYLSWRGAFEFLGVEEDREFEMRRQGVLASDPYQLPDQMVQARSKMMNDLPGQDPEPDKGFLLVRRWLDSSREAPKLWLSDQSVCVEGLPDFDIETGDVLIGPFDLREASVEARRSHDRY